MSTKPLDRETYIATASHRFALTKKTATAILGPLLDERDALREQLAAARAEHHELFELNRTNYAARLEAEATAERLAGALKLAAATIGEEDAWHVRDDEGEIDCPQDDTCCCVLPEVVNAALATFKSGTALAEHDAKVRETERMKAQADVTRAMLEALDHPETLVLPDIPNWLAEHDKALTERVLGKAAREVCFQCQSPQLFPLDPTQHGRYHVSADDLSNPIEARTHTPCEGTRILRLFLSPLYPDVCGTPGCPCCEARALTKEPRK
jgi:hypothetical protein